MDETCHSDEESWLLGSTANAGVTYNADSKASGKTGKTNGETCAKLDETLE